jgi:dolichol-phosphate mannosyltransferase
MSTICIAIPTYNERENLPILIEQLNRVFRQKSIDASIIIIDDNSPDGTGEIADGLSHKSAKIRVIHRPGKAGLGSAYKEAFALALSMPTTSVVVEMDADLSHDPQLLPSLIEPLAQGTDIVVASRKVPGGGVPDWSFRRRLVSSTANLIVKTILRISVNDATSGYRSFSRNALEKIKFRTLTSEGFGFQIETLTRAKRASLAILEVPMIFRDRKLGKSKLRQSEIWNFLKTLARLTLN